jgi:FlaA1/EpsC-like NDP-sugar epimerase
MWRILIRHRRILIGLLHAAIVSASVTGAFLLQFAFAIPKPELQNLTAAVWIAVAVKIAVFLLAGFDRGWWRYVSVADVYTVLIGNFAASGLFGLISHAAMGPVLPRSLYVIDFLICFFLTAATRFSVRLYYESIAKELSREHKKCVLIYGAGAAGVTLVREIHSNPALAYRVVGFLDDQRGKRHAVFAGVPVFGSGRDAPRIVERYRRGSSRVEEIVIAMPSATGRQMREALANCRAAGVPVKTIPGMGELLTGKVLTSQIRDVSVLDLLGREPVQLDETLIRSSIQGNSVMVTGGGGSIGSELCRQIAGFRPSQLVIFERSESDLFRIHNELMARFPDVEIVPRIGDIREFARVEETLRCHSVRSIFHAAAYKHVPLMETHVLEAVKNNVLGTRNVVNAALRCGVSDFLMISSDKAVNPSSVMGLTKRIAELIVNGMPPPREGSGTKFVSVRFGNVLGSNGSVVPLFMQQIAAGGPVTVTHPEMRRYFMTIPEAVQLVLQASTMGSGSEIFVLDMGEPVRIVDLAQNMIRLSGREAGIEIRFVGLRPGEKLFEELLTEGENILPTYHEKIRIFRGPRKDPAEMDAWLTGVEALMAPGDEAGLMRRMVELVPEYRSSAAITGGFVEHIA